MLVIIESFGYAKSTLPLEMWTSSCSYQKKGPDQEKCQDKRTYFSTVNVSTTVFPSERTAIEFCHFKSSCLYTRVKSRAIPFLQGANITSEATGIFCDAQSDTLIA